MRCGLNAARKTTGEVAKLPQRLELNLTHPLPGHFHQAADLSEGVTLVALQPETKSEHMLFLITEVAEPATQLLVMNPLLNNVQGLIE